MYRDEKDNTKYYQHVFEFRQFKMQLNYSTIRLLTRCEFISQNKKSEKGQT